MTRLVLLGALVLAAACGGKSSGETADPCKDPCADQKIAAMTCDGMGKNIGDQMRATGEWAEGEIEDMVGMIVYECGEAAWSQQTIDCLAAATAASEAEACEESTMTAEQRDSFRAKQGGSTESPEEANE